MTPRLLAFLAFLALAALLALHAWHYFPFLSDDALVSLRYAKRFATGDGLTWTDGERVEGYANFLWVVLTGAVGRLGIGYVESARLLGFAGVLLAVASAGLEPRGQGVSPLRLLAGGALIVATAPFAIWAIGGLEQGALAGLLGLSLRLLERAAYAPAPRAVWLSSAPLALLSLLRADGLLLALAASAGAACLPRPSADSLRRAVRTAAPSVVVVLAHLGFRRAYYGEWQPNVALVKLASAPEHMVEGLAYVGHGYSSVSMLVLLALAATARALRRPGGRFRLVLPWAVTVSWTAYVVAIGGDAGPGYRQLVPALVPLCFLIADELCSSLAEVREQQALVLPVLGLGIALHAMLGLEVSDNRRALEDTSDRDGRSIAHTLKSAFGESRPLLAVDRAGALPFWSELPSLDMRGRNDWHIARRPPREFPKGRAGLDFGDGAYVLDREPDLVVFGDSKGTWKPEFRSGRRLVRSSEFRETYQWVRIEGSVGNRASGQIWIRREGGKVGVRRSPSRIEVPGYFLTGSASDATSRLDRGGRLAAHVSAANPGVLPSLEIPAGRWRVAVEPAHEKLVFDLRCNDASMSFQGADSTRVFQLDASSGVSVALAPTAGGDLAVRTVSFERDASSAPARRCLEEGEPLRVPAARLVVRKERDAAVEHASSVLFARDGVVVDLGRRERASHLELSLSNDDGYALELRLDGHAVWSDGAELRPRARSKRRATEMRVRRYELPKTFGPGVFELFVKPSEGKRHRALGHVELR